MMEDAIKSDKASTMKRRSLKKSIVVEERENVEVMKVEKKKDIDLAVSTTTKKEERKLRMMRGPGPLSQRLVALLE